MIVFIVVLAVVAGILEFISLKMPISDIEYDIYFSRPAAEPDEPFDIISKVGTRRKLPVSFLRMRETLPDGVSADIPKATGGFSRTFQASTPGLPASVSCRVFLLPRQTVTLRFPASMPRRGRYFVGDTMLYMGDFLGIKETYEKRVLNRELVVLPKRAEDAELSEALGGFMGDVSVRRFILEDPILTLGFREYTGREPLRSISWAQSARAGSLMVKTYDYTVDPSATVLLNTECSAGTEDESREDLIEKCFSYARTVCEELEARGIHYDFVTNATAAGAAGSWSSIGDGLGAMHLESILTGLGRATYAFTSPFSVILERTALSALTSRAYIVITPSVDEKYKSGISKLRDISGLDVFVINAVSKEAGAWK